MNPNTIWCLPEELIANILARLPVKTLLQIKSVCRSWCSLINNPYFVKFHLNRTVFGEDNLRLLLYNERIYKHVYSIEPCSSAVEASIELDVTPLEESSSSPGRNVRISGSCNGLILITNDLSYITLWNPSTRDFMELPLVPDNADEDATSQRGKCWRRTFGLGYDSRNDDYKVLRIFYYPSANRSSNHEESEAFVYSLRSNTWKRTNQDIPYAVYDTGRYLNEAVHWIGHPHPKRYLGLRIVSFNFGSEDCREIPVPDRCNFDASPEINLSVLRECLCLFYSLGGACADIYVMKEYGVKESWCKIYTISRAEVNGLDLLDCRLLCFTNNGKILLQQIEEVLVLYDPMRQNAENIEIHGIPNQLIDIGFFVHTYMKSLVRLKFKT